MGKRVIIGGVWHSVFGKLEEETIYSLYEKALKGIIAETNLDASEIDMVVVANYSGGGFNNQENIAPYGVNILPELRYKPMYRVETACSSGSSAIQMGMLAIRSGTARRVVVVGLEKMTSVSNSEVSRALAMATLWPEEGHKGIDAPCLFSTLARGYIKKHGVSENELRQWLAMIASKAYTSAADNPLSHLKKPRTAEEILNLPDDKNPVIKAPLRLHDCSLISDGASAILLEEEKISQGTVELVESGNFSDDLSNFGSNKPDHTLEGVLFGTKKLLKETRRQIWDLDIIELHDCFTITELLMYSALGLAEPGQEAKMLEDGTVYPDGKLPVNPSGGLKAKGHPIGATGVSMHAHVYRQLLGKAYGIQVDGAETGLVVNIGGAATSNSVSLLKKLA